MDQMTGLEALHQQVEQSIEHLRSESEHLKQADETIRRQREALHSTFRDCEQKQLHFQTKGGIPIVERYTFTHNVSS